MAAKKPVVKTVARSRIVVDADILPRVALADDTSARYRELLEEGYKFPPLDVFEIPVGTCPHRDFKLYLVDGTYRLGASDLIHRSLSYKVKVTIHQGTRSDAMWFAAGANQDHGLPLTHGQRLTALSQLVTDPEIAKKSDRAIAKQCGVSPSTVASYRRAAQQTFEFRQEKQGVQTGQGVPPVTASDSGGDESAGASAAPTASEALDSSSPEDGSPPAPAVAVDISDEDSAGATGGHTTPGALGEPEETTEGPTAPAEWPESIKETILNGTEVLKHLASLCRHTAVAVRAVGDECKPGTCMFHVPAALERLRRFKLAVTRAIPFCVCVECHGDGKDPSAPHDEPCNRCDARGWLVRAETDEEQPTHAQLNALESRGVPTAGMSKAEAARQLDDLFAAETWQQKRKLQAQQNFDETFEEQDRQKHQANNAGEDSKSWV